MNETFEARKAIESLRAGVPNLAAVSALRVDHPELVSSFDKNLKRIKVGPVPQASNSRGFFVEGNFGSGKSHALRFLETIAGKNKFACSSVAISKEAPLHDLNAIFRSAISSLNLGPGVLGGSLAPIFEKLDPHGEAFNRLCEMLAVSESKGAPLFLASLLLYKRYRSAPEIVEQLCDFWDGGPAQIGPWKKLLRDVDDVDLALKSIRIEELSIERFRFAAVALSVAGYGGWFIALDELELISKFGLKSRAKAYASLSLLFADDSASANDGLWFVVGAVTGDLNSEVILKRDDLSAIKNALRWEPELLAKAVKGIEILLERDRTIRLKQPNVLDLRRSYDAIRALYEKAYLVKADGAYSASSGRLSKSMRQYVREWIAYWDLKMQDPAYEPSISSRALQYSLAEDSDLESESA